MSEKTCKIGTSSPLPRKRSLDDGIQGTHIHKKRTYAVTSSNEESCNGVLFIFQTRCPTRILLKLDTAVVYTNNSFSHLFPEDLPPGRVKLLSSRNDFVVYIYVFTNKKGCSLAEDADFEGVRLTEDLMDSTKIISKMENVQKLAAWSYYCLDNKPPSDNSDSYVFPKPMNEFQRMVYLKERIKEKYGSIFIEGQPNSTSYSINIFQRHSEGYCEFSGGGDLLIVDSNANSSLTIQSQFPIDCEPSPNNSCDEILSKVIEAKSYLDITPAICHQVHANMILGIVDSFVEKIKCGFYTNEDSKKIGHLIRYGIVCTGAFWFAFYKIVIDLVENEIIISTKVEPSCRPPSGVVKHIDYCIDYFLAKTH